MTKKYKYNISLMKTISILIVVLYHSMMFYSGNWFAIMKPSFKIDSWIFEIINNFQMPVFVFCLGYLFYLKDRSNKHEEIKKKFKRLIIPYIIISITYVIPINIYFLKSTGLEIVKNFVFGFAPNQL